MQFSDHKKCWKIMDLDLEKPASIKLFSRSWHVCEMEGTYEV